MQERPNIVLLMTDQMRGDCLGIAGHPDVKTPYLDSLADMGNLYTNAYSVCPTCVPARAMLHTGMSQEHTGRVGYEDGVRWNYAHTMAGELSKAGYYTQCVGKMHVHPLRNYLGFHHVRLHDGYMHAYRAPDIPYRESQKVADDYYWWLKQELGVKADPLETGLDCNGWVTRPWMYEEKYHPTNWVADECLDFLRRRDPDMPFFLMASFVRPHAPLDPPQCYLDLYKDKDLRPPYFGDWNDRERLEKEGHSYHSLTGPCDREYVRQMRAAYYGSITHMDHQIGRILLDLVERKLMDNTVILFLSDHGDMLGDHLQFQKAKPYQGSIHIPLFISGPEKYVGEGHRRCSDLVGLQDIMPTLLELAGAPIPDSVDGRSLLHPISCPWLHGEHTLGELSSQFIVTKRDKYIWYSQTGEEQYFHLEQDPHEAHNRIHDTDCHKRITELRGCLIEALKDREEGYVRDGQLVVGQRPLTVLSNIRR
ncbi:MAG: arylsulfatase [Lachnospiraceae bacterium]